MIHEMRKRGMSITRIAQEMGRDRKTIRKWLNKKEPESYQRKVIRLSKLDPFKDYVRRRMEDVCPECQSHSGRNKGRPYRARTKGKVENGIGYVRKNFWPRVRVLQDWTI
jgi:transposase